MTTEEPKVADNGRYNTKQTCEYMGVSYKTLMVMVENGLIKHEWMGTVRNWRPRRIFLGKEIKKAWRERVCQRYSNLQNNRGR